LSLCCAVALSDLLVPEAKTSQGKKETREHAHSPLLPPKPGDDSKFAEKGLNKAYPPLFTATPLGMRSPMMGAMGSMGPMGSMGSMGAMGSMGPMGMVPGMGSVVPGMALRPMQDPMTNLMMNNVLLNNLLTDMVRSKMEKQNHARAVAAGRRAHGGGYGGVSGGGGSSSSRGGSRGSRGGTGSSKKKNKKSKPSKSKKSKTKGTANKKTGTKSKSKKKKGFQELESGYDYDEELSTGVGSISRALNPAADPLQALLQPAFPPIQPPGATMDPGLVEPMDQGGVVEAEALA